MAKVQCFRPPLDEDPVACSSIMKSSPSMFGLDTVEKLADILSETDSLPSAGFSCTVRLISIQGECFNLSILLKKETKMLHKENVKKKENLAATTSTYRGWSG